MAKELDEEQYQLKEYLDGAKPPSCSNWNTYRGKGGIRFSCRFKRTRMPEERHECLYPDSSERCVVDLYVNRNGEFAKTFASLKENLTNMVKEGVPGSKIQLEELLYLQSLSTPHTPGYSLDSRGELHMSQGDKDYITRLLREEQESTKIIEKGNAIIVRQVVNGRYRIPKKNC